MKKLVIKEINNYDYLLEDDKNNQYELNFEFCDFDQKISTGDIIYIPNRLLGLDKVYSFGPLKEEDNIREVVPFPLSANGTDQMMGCPSEVFAKQLKETHIKIDE